MSTPLLEVEGLRKIYTQGLLAKRETFRLEADFRIDEPAIVGLMGPNGSGVHFTCLPAGKHQQTRRLSVTN